MLFCNKRAVQCFAILLQFQHSVRVQEPPWPLLNKAGNQDHGCRDKKDLNVKYLNIIRNSVESTWNQHSVQWLGSSLATGTLLCCVSPHGWRSMFHSVSNPKSCHLSYCQRCQPFREVTVGVCECVCVWKQIKSEFNPSTHPTHGSRRETHRGERGRSRMRWGFWVLGCSLLMGAFYRRSV